MIKLFAAILVLTSCSYKNSLNKEPHSSLPSFPVVSKNVDEAWKSTLTFFNNKSIPVVVAEKSSQYIITAPVTVQCGSENDSDADIVLIDSENIPATATARYKVKITEMYGQTTLIPTLEDIYTGDHKCAVKSTGKLEKTLSEYVNK